MKQFLVPDYYYDSIFDIDTSKFVEQNIKGVILDIDNTLVPYEVAEPTKEIRVWLDNILSLGMSIAFVSNNNSSRVKVFNNTLGFHAFYSSKKPFRKSCFKAMAAMGTVPQNTVIIGDQIFTDIFVGRRCKLHTVILVKPIKDRNTIFTKVKRVLEKPILTQYQKINSSKDENDQQDQ